MLKKIALALGSIVILILGVAAMQPDTFSVTRGAIIAAPPADVFAHVNDFHKWAAWSPWEKKDLAMKKTFSGAPEGTGAIYDWTGNNDVGEGRMTLAASQPTDRIEIKMEFKKPFEDTSKVEFLFKPEGAGTNVVWNMAGKYNFFTKVICLFVSMDKMVGNDFAEGLSQLKTVAEASVKK